MDKLIIPRFPSKSERYAQVRSKGEERKLAIKKDELEKIRHTETRNLLTTRNKFVLDRRQSMGNVYNAQADGARGFLRSKTNRRDSDPEILDIFRKQEDRRKSVKQIGSAVNADVMKRLEEKYQKVLASNDNDFVEDESEGEDDVIYIPGDQELVDRAVQRSGDTTEDTYGYFSDVITKHKADTEYKLKHNPIITINKLHATAHDTVAENSRLMTSTPNHDVEHGVERSTLKHSNSVPGKRTRLEVIKAGADRGRSYSDGDVTVDILELNRRLQLIEQSEKMAASNADTAPTDASGRRDVQFHRVKECDQEGKCPITPPQTPMDSSPTTLAFTYPEKDCSAQMSPLLKRRSIADDAFGSPTGLPSMANDASDTPRPIYRQADPAFRSKNITVRHIDKTPVEPRSMFQPNDGGMFRSPKLHRRTDDVPRVTFQDDGSNPGSPVLAKRPLVADFGSPKMARNKRYMEKPKSIYQQNNISPFASPRSPRRKKDIVFTAVSVSELELLSSPTNRRGPLNESPRPIFQLGDETFGPAATTRLGLQTDVSAHPRMHRRSRSEAIDLETLLAHREIDFPEIPRMKRRGSENVLGDSEHNRKPPKAWNSLMYGLALNDEEREEVSRVKRRELVASLRRRQLELDNDVSRRIQTFLQRHDDAQ